jgi:hypothetical protein
MDEAPGYMDRLILSMIFRRLDSVETEVGSFYLEHLIIHLKTQEEGNALLEFLKHNLKMEFVMRLET